MKSLCVAANHGFSGSLCVAANHGVSGSHLEAGPVSYRIWTLGWLGTMDSVSVFGDSGASTSQLWLAPVLMLSICSLTSAARSWRASSFSVLGLLYSCVSFSVSDLVNCESVPLFSIISLVHFLPFRAIPTSLRMGWTESSSRKWLHFFGAMRFNMKVSSFS